jgi:hypothetical protein
MVMDEATRKAFRMWELLKLTRLELQMMFIDLEDELDKLKKK